MSKEAESVRNVRRTFKPGFGCDYTIDAFISSCSCGHRNAINYGGNNLTVLVTCSSCEEIYEDGPYQEKKPL